jgi:hypothetical protein
MRTTQRNAIGYAKFYSRAEADFFLADFIRGSILIAVSWCGQSCSGDYPQFFAKVSATPGPQPLFQTMLFWQRLRAAPPSPDEFPTPHNL